MNNRVAFLICLDTAMLLLVLVLETIPLTGLEVHERLGFALCPLVLLHVVMQWQWCVTQFQRIFTPGAFRVRANALLNLALLVLMAAVLVSGVFESRQATALVGEGLGRVRVWSEVHGLLNFVLLVLVGLHLALNWDWIIAALRRRRPVRPALVATPIRNGVAASGRHPPALVKYLWRGLVVLLISSLAAGAVYLVTAAMLPPGKRAPMQDQRLAAVTANGPPQNQFAPRPRPADVPEGIGRLAYKMAVTVLVVIIGRYVFRLRL